MMTEAKMTRDAKMILSMPNLPERTYAAARRIIQLSVDMRQTRSIIRLADRMGANQ